MKRDIIEIDEALCDGCGQCVTGCHEGALAIVDGKARLVSEVYCDGLGACIGECPRGALRVVQKDAPAFDEVAVEAHLARAHETPAPAQPRLLTEIVPPPSPTRGGCPGSAHRQWAPGPAAPAPGSPGIDAGPAVATTSQLRSWPVQLGLINPAAPCLKGAHLLVCADCVPFAVPDFHDRFLKGRVPVVACPKLDNIEAHAGKLAEIFRVARPASVTVVRMEVPCCGGLVRAVEAARAAVSSDVDVRVDIVAIGG